MIADQKYTSQPLEFWANVKLISQKVGYTERSTSKIKIPTQIEIEKTYQHLELDASKISRSGRMTKFGRNLRGYFEHRANFLNDVVEPNLMKKEQAEQLFTSLVEEYDPKCPIPMNKQKGEKKQPAYFTGIINILIEANSKGYPCDFDPKSLTLFTEYSFPTRSLSRRVDGAFPKAINPIAIWEVKEYYNTTTFGSRVADGVYETLLDGYELYEVRKHTKKNVRHYLMVDDYFTWWTMGKSYLCRICDMLHMGLLTEAFFGREVVDRLPIVVKEWVDEMER